jgi:isopropylmalate/homocitrate/citramalate synthase
MIYERRTDDMPSQATLEVAAYAAELTAKARAKEASLNQARAEASQVRWLKRKRGTGNIEARLAKIEEGVSRFIEREEAGAERKRTAAKQERLAKIKEMVNLAGERVMQNAGKPERATVVRNPGHAKFFEIIGKGE